MSDSVTLCTIVRQAPLSMGFSKQEYWSGLPFPPPGALPNPGNGTANPMPLSDYIDFFVIGEGEYILNDILNAYLKSPDKKANNKSEKIDKIE